MSATVGLAMPVNGTVSSESEPKDSPEYEKILNLRDQIYAGSHPRLKVPAGAIRKVTPRSVQTPPLPPVVAKEASTGPPAPQTNGFSLHNANSARKNSQLSISPSVSRLPPPKLNSSELDPIFLTKSDTLKHAEFQLKRQRIERALKDEYEQKKKKVLFSQDDRPYFDVSEALAKALELVKPITLSDANGNAAASESFDENSLYSSRAPDSTPERGHHRRSSSPRNHQHQLMDIDDLDADTRAEHDHGPRRQYHHGDGNVVDLHQDDSPPKNGPQGRYPLRSRRSPVQYESPRVPDDTFEEPEYSPPEPDEPSVVNRDNGVPIQGGYQPITKPGNGRPYNAPYRNGSPVADVRIVRSHITSPAAPQPARISPLAVAKAPSIPQTRYQQQAQTSQGPRYGHESARTSPEPEILQTRKRRRGQEGNNRGRNGFNKNGPTPRKKPRHSNNSNTQRVQDSPEPYIKPEPVSPPSFSAVPSLAPPKVRQVVDRSGPVEIQSPREIRYVTYPESRDYDMPRQYVSYTETPLPPKIQYSCSRIEHRRPIREEQDLRRVASYNTRQPMLPQEYVEPLSSAHTAPVRGQSYAIIDRQAPPQPRQYYEDDVPAYSRQVVRSVRSPSPILHERYAEVEPQPRVMAPPQKRIVMDENGNKYYETVTIPRVQQSMAPPSRLPRVEYQEPISMRQPSVRSTSVFEDPQSGRRYISEMPPSQPAYRRVAEVADPYAVSGAVGRRVHDRPEFEQRPMYRSASVQALDYPQRQPRYIEETLAPREDVVRMSSVRPIPTRYEDQPQVIQRVQSVRPEGREVSVFVDEPRRQREYVQAPLDRTAYEYVRQLRETMYMDDDDMRRVVMEGPRGSGPGAAPRH